MTDASPAAYAPRPFSPVVIPDLPHSIHIDLDGAFPPSATPEGATYLDRREWGPRLRYSAKKSGVETFYDTIRPQAARFTLFGSGDFHHLSALWLRRIEKPFVLLSFDNHPDWDIRPPRWCCGTWINRALELPMLQRAAIWGCGNFELNWPGYLFVSGRALRRRRLEVWPWTERLAPSGIQRWGGITREDWRAKFQEFTRGLAGADVYITVDLDCLEPGASVTNWEPGLFTHEDIAWAISEVRQHGAIIGGDLCGAYSTPRYERRLQGYIADRDHPPGPVAHLVEAARINGLALASLWPVLTAI